MGVEKHEKTEIAHSVGVRFTRHELETLHDRARQEERSLSGCIRFHLGKAGVFDRGSGRKAVNRDQ